MKFKVQWRILSSIQNKNKFIYKRTWVRLKVHTIRKMGSCHEKFSDLFRKNSMNDQGPTGANKVLFKVRSWVEMMTHGALHVQNNGEKCKHFPWSSVNFDKQSKQNLIWLLKTECVFSYTVRCLGSQYKSCKLISHQFTLLKNECTINPENSPLWPYWCKKDGLQQKWVVRKAISHILSPQQISLQELVEKRRWLKATPSLLHMSKIVLRIRSRLRWWSVERSASAQAGISIWIND